MADPRLFDAPAAAELEQATGTLRALLADVPGADALYAGAAAAPTGTGAVFGSPASLLEAAANDHQVRDAHGLTILAGALARVVADQQRQIEELKAATGGGPRSKGKAGR